MDLTKRERTGLIVNSVVITTMVFLLLIIGFIYSSSLIFKLLVIYFTISIILCSVNIFRIIRPKNTSPTIVEDIEFQKDKINQELQNVEINPIGKIVMIIEKVGYADPTYATKPYRLRYWREKGKIILTDKELIFLGKKINFSILLSEIETIQPFVSKSGTRTFNIFEIIYNNEQQKASAVFMGLLRSAFDFLAEIELKSSKLMELIQKWYDSWKND